MNEEIGLFLDISRANRCKIILNNGLVNGVIRGKMISNNKWSRNRLKYKDWVRVRILDSEPLTVLIIAKLLESEVEEDLKNSLLNKLEEYE